MLRPEEMPDGAEVAATLRFSIAPAETPQAASATAS
jgi:hypothetical protein